MTGATGYIGQRLIRAALLANYEVLGLSRRPTALADVVWQYFELDEVGQFTLPSDVAVVFHLAANTQRADGSESELVGAQRIIAAANSVGANFVFVSSQTAREDAPTGYGRIKWQIERMTLAAGGWVYRPGLVYGGPECGLFGRLCNLIQSLPVLPAFIPSPLVQPVHVDDLAKALLSYLNLPSSSVLCIGASDPIKFTKFLQAIARYRVRRNIITVSIPTSLINCAVKVMGTRLSSKYGLDRLQSLFALPIMEISTDLQRVLPTLRSLEAGLSPAGRVRRPLLFEANMLLTYLLRMPPNPILMRRYVRAIEILRHDRALRLSKIFFFFPAMLALIEGARCINNEFQNEFSWRLNTALILAEASPQGALRFLGINQRQNWLINSIRMLKAIFSEAIRRVAQLIFFPILFYVGRQGVFE